MCYENIHVLIDAHFGISTRLTKTYTVINSVLAVQLFSTNLNRQRERSNLLSVPFSATDDKLSVCNYKLSCVLKEWGKTKYNERLTTTRLADELER